MSETSQSSVGSTPCDQHRGEHLIFTASISIIGLRCSERLRCSGSTPLGASKLHFVWAARLFSAVSYSGPANKTLQFSNPSHSISAFFRNWGGPAPPCQASAPCLSERPVRTVQGGNLRKFPRGVGQFPFSFPTHSRGVPISTVKSPRAGRAPPSEATTPSDFPWA